ncbi:fungal-specific transcription factor domain-containing protein [Lentinula edodes]|uniref:fungal-specific transcription factor domain-containing protein n=1 Tax=Lentinula edodes TaxID=5353 RepID=UPI001E8E4E39|nr:fungal-specific transcription factor domain-containing protein [Lentinula edodes]KAH7880406.1 fungal-specific transcription factor domain-containing protein [Lentinula edodes]
MNSTKGPPSSRRATKTLSASQQKAVEEKRLRGELSCAECRRLKLRCDRQVPCGSCSRRGCASICPSGVLEAGAGHVHQGGMRVGQLRTKIGIMASRIRELEAALGEGHALLEERLLRIGRIDEEPPEEPGSISQLEGLGTLTLGEEGEASYFGSSGGNESLIAREMMLHSNSNEDDDSDGSSLNPSPELFTAVAGSSVSDEEAILPSEEEGRSLALAYCATGALFFRAWKREELWDEVIPKVYGPGGASAHLQSALFFVFALGAYLSPKKVNGLHEEQAEIWFQRGRAAFHKKDKKRNSPEDTIRALGLMGTYFSMASRHHSRDSAWAALALAAKLCQGAGLHRDPARWNLPSALVQRRRALFWEVYQSDISHSIALGRPPTTPLSFVDCEYPDEDPMSHQDICNLKYRYSRDAFIPIMDLVLSAYPTKRSYREVVELDAKIRKLQVPIPPSDNGLKTFFANQLLNAVILTLHRSYMARAILNGKEAAAKGEDPNKPFDPFDSAQTPYAPSVTAAYHAAEEISRSLHGFAVTDSEIAGRVWFLTYHGFSAALVLGALASRAPGSTYAPTAIMTLSLVVDGVFAKYVHVSARHRTAFVILRRLKTRAIRRYTAFLESKAGTRNESGNHGDAGAVGSPDGDPGHIGLGPGAVNPDDPTFRIKLDSDPESDFEEPVHQRTHPSEPSAPSTNENGGLATFEGKIAMFGGKTNVLLSSKGKKGKSGLKRKKTEYEGSVSVSSPESLVAASPESTTSTPSDSQGISTTSASIIQQGGRPPNRLSAQTQGSGLTQGVGEVSNHSIDSMSMDVFMADTNMQESSTDSAFDGMEGIENLNVDAFSFGYDNFGTDAGSGIVMGMALEDIGMGTNMGMSSFALGSSPASTTSAGTSGSTSLGSTELQSQEGSTSSAFNVYQQHYGGGFAVRTSLSPEASGSSPPTQQQEPDEEQEPLTATAQAARMFGMGSLSYPFLTSNSNANNTDIGQSYAASSSNEYSNLNVFTTYTKQQLAVGSAQGQPQPPKSSNSIQSSTSYLQQQQSQPTTSSNSPTNYNSASFDPPTNSQTGHSHPQSQNTSSLTSSFAPSSSVSPLLGDPAQLYARFAEFMSQKAASSPQHTQQTQTMSQIPQEAQQQRQNVQGYTPVSNSYNYYGFAGNANGYFGPSGPQSMNTNPNPNSQATDFEYNADFDAFLRSFRTPDAGIGSTLTGGGEYVLPYGQMYGQWQDQTHSGGT